MLQVFEYLMCLGSADISRGKRLPVTVRVGYQITIDEGHNPETHLYENLSQVSTDATSADKKCSGQSDLFRYDTLLTT
jgi:hypothetical protein